MSSPRDLVDAVARTGAGDRAILDAIARVPRDRFVPPELADRAWQDEPLPLAGGRATAHPSAAARMIGLARVRPGARVLDVGTGSGWQAAVLAALGAEVCTIELDPELFAQAARRLAELAPGVATRHGDGRLGWPERAPFDAILVGAASEHVPPALLDQLAEGGTLVLPSGTRARQELVTLTREPGGAFTRRGHGAVAYQPLT